MIASGNGQHVRDTGESSVNEWSRQEQSQQRKAIQDQCLLVDGVVAGGSKFRRRRPEHALVSLPDGRVLVEGKKLRRMPSLSVEGRAAASHDGCRAEHCNVGCRRQQTPFGLSSHHRTHPLGQRKTPGSSGCSLYLIAIVHTVVGHVVDVLLLQQHHSEIQIPRHPISQILPLSHAGVRRQQVVDGFADGHAARLLDNGGVLLDISVLRVPGHDVDGLEPSEHGADVSARHVGQYAQDLVADAPLFSRAGFQDGISG